MNLYDGYTVILTKTLIWKLFFKVELGKCMDYSHCSYDHQLATFHVYLLLLDITKWAPQGGGGDSDT